MVWGIISSDGPEHLIWINRNKEKFNSDAYITMLSNHKILGLITKTGMEFSRMVPPVTLLIRQKLFFKKKTWKFLSGPPNLLT